MKILDYLYSKSKMKKEQDERLQNYAEHISLLGRNNTNLHAKWNQLKIENHRMQLFIEANVSKEEKDKFFL